MNIIDTNGITHAFKKGIDLKDTYYLAPDVAEEVEITELVYGKSIPKKIFDLRKSGKFDEAIYINHYKGILNKYGGRSFFNMTGFGDVSILASLHMLMDVFAKQAKEQLFDTSEQIVIYTNDDKLATKINKEFAGKDILVSSIDKIK